MKQMNSRRLMCLFASFLFVVLACLSPFASTVGFAEGALYQMGDRGQKVLDIKERLQELNYIGSNSRFDSTYNKYTKAAVEAFQRANGLEVTGELSASDVELLYSDAVLPAPVPTATPAPTAVPTATPIPISTPQPFAPADPPERDADGYLAEDGEYFYENDEEGQWAYLSDDLQIIIHRYTDTSIPLIWFETEMWLRGEQRLLTTENDPERPGRKFSYPYDIATKNHYVLGFTDDFYGHRIYNNQKQGVVIRDGQIICSDPYSKRMRNLPNLDMLAQFPDGRLQTYDCASITAEELLALGAINVYCFGPAVIRDGVMDELVSGRKYETKSPRQLLGMIEPNHYLLVTVQGRMSDSIGSGLIKPTEIMLARGVKEGYNLDGGNTMALIFNGRMLNNLAKWKNRKFVRTVSSLIGLGVSDQVQPATEEK